MVTSQQVVPGMILSVDDKLFRCESAIKVTVAKGQPFIKTSLRNLVTDKVVEKNFKIGEEVTDVQLEERVLEYLYLEGKNYLFLDIGRLDQVQIPPSIIGDNVNFLKEGITLQAIFYGETIFSIELPQFLELMVAKTADSPESGALSNAVKVAVLETGAPVEVPLFIEAGDVIKVDTRSKEYIQRV